MNSEYEQRNNALDMLKQRVTQGPPTLTDQQPNVLYTMPVRTVERLENVLRNTLALQERIRAAMADLATKESLTPLATTEELLNWINQVHALNQQTYRSIQEILTEMREENRQAGKEKDKFTQTLSDMEKQFRADGENIMDSFRLWIPLTIMGSAAVSVIISILLWVLMR